MSVAGSYKSHQQAVHGLAQLDDTWLTDQEDQVLLRVIALIAIVVAIGVSIGDLDLLDLGRPAKSRLQVVQVAEEASWVLSWVSMEFIKGLDGISIHTCWHTLLFSLQPSQLAAPAVLCLHGRAKGSFSRGS